MARQDMNHKADDGRTFVEHSGLTEKAWLKERHTRINGTEVASLVNNNPYCTPFELWHRKHGDIGERYSGGARGAAGKALEPVIAKMVAKELGCKVRKVKSYFSNSDGMGATMDYEVIEGAITLPNEEGTLTRVDAKGWLVEIKNVDYLIFRDNWAQRVDGIKFVEPPVHIELQGQHQCEVACRPGVIFATLVGGNDLQMVYRPADRVVGAGLRELCANFWETIGKNQEPEVDFTKDLEVVEILYGDAEKGSVYDGLQVERLKELCEQYANAGALEKNAKAAKSAAKAEVLTIIGSAHKAIVPGFTLSAGVTAPSPGTLITQEMVGTITGGRKGFRAIRISRKKESK